MHNQNSFMKKSIHLNIPEPCHEHWDQMTPVEKGRFCGSCQKQVVDFTTMSDTQLVTFFRKPSTGSVCGRFMQDQLDRTIDIPKKRIPWVKYFFQFLLPGFLMSCGARTTGKIKITESKNEAITKSTCSQTTGVVMMDFETIVLPDTTQKTVSESNEVNDCENIGNNQSPKKEFLMGNDENVLMPIQVQGEVAEKIIYELSTSINIKGNVIDDNDQPIPYASVYIKGTSIGVAADSLGNFSLKYVGIDDSIVLISSCAGFQNTESMVRLTKSEETITISLGEMNALGEVVITSYPTEIKEELIFTGAVVVVKKKIFLIQSVTKFFRRSNHYNYIPIHLKAVLR